jgi:hypothetical protein
MENWDLPEGIAELPEFSLLQAKKKIHAIAPAEAAKSHLLFVFISVKFR